MAAAPPTFTSPLPFEGFSVTLANSNTVVEANPQPYNNTKEVIVYNPGPAIVLMKVVDLSAGLPAAGTVTAATSTLIPVAGTISLAIGPEGDRQPLGTVAFWGAGDGSNLGIVFKQLGNQSLDIAVTYVQTVGGFTGPS